VGGVVASVCRQPPWFQGLGHRRHGGSVARHAPPRHGAPLRAEISRSQPPIRRPMQRRRYAAATERRRRRRQLRSRPVARRIAETPSRRAPPRRPAERRFHSVNLLNSPDNILFFLGFRSNLPFSLISFFWFVFFLYIKVAAVGGEEAGGGENERE